MQVLHIIISFILHKWQVTALLAIRRLLISARNYPKSPNTTQVTTYSPTVQSAAQQKLMIAPALWQRVLNGQAPLTFLQKMLKPSFSVLYFPFFVRVTNKQTWKLFFHLEKNSNKTFHRCMGCYDKSGQKVSLGFQQWRHADRGRTR